MIINRLNLLPFSIKFMSLVKNLFSHSLKLVTNGNYFTLDINLIEAWLISSI